MLYLVSTARKCCCMIENMYQLCVGLAFSHLAVVAETKARKTEKKLANARKHTQTHANTHKRTQTHANARKQ